MQTIIRIGHPAYTGINAARVCFSKAQAVRVLRARGVKRDDARQGVKKIVTERGFTSRTTDGDFIEGLLFTGEFVDQSTLPAIRAFWKNQPEA